MGIISRHINTVIVGTIILGTIGLTVTAIIAAITGAGTVASNTGAGAFLAALAGGIYGGGYAAAAHQRRLTRLARVEDDVADIRARVTRVESEQLSDITETLSVMEQSLGITGDGNVRRFPRGS